jgi:hypothetical protein
MLKRCSGHLSSNELPDVQEKETAVAAAKKDKDEQRQALKKRTAAYEKEYTDYNKKLIDLRREVPTSISGLVIVPLCLEHWLGLPGTGPQIRQQTVYRHYFLANPGAHPSRQARFLQVQRHRNHG